MGEETLAKMAGLKLRTSKDNLLSRESESIDRVVKAMENEEKEFSKIYEELVRREGDIFKDLDF